MSQSSIKPMAQEDTIREDWGKLFVRISKIPRPMIREKLLWDILNYAAAALGVKVEERKPNG